MLWNDLFTMIPILLGKLMYIKPVRSTVDTNLHRVYWFISSLISAGWCVHNLQFPPRKQGIHLNRLPTPSAIPFLSSPVRTRETAVLTPLLCSILSQPPPTCPDTALSPPTSNCQGALSPGVSSYAGSGVCFHSLLLYLSDFFRQN